MISVIYTETSTDVCRREKHKCMLLQRAPLSIRNHNLSVGDSIGLHSKLFYHFFLNIGYSLDFLTCVNEFHI